MVEYTPYRDGLPGHYSHAPETSREAAEHVADAAKSREELALRFIRGRGLFGATADEVAGTLEWERYSSRPRLSTLKAEGKIVDSGARRKGASGRNQAVWIAREFAPRAEPEQVEMWEAPE